MIHFADKHIKWSCPDEGRIFLRFIDDKNSGVFAVDGDIDDLVQTAFEVTVGLADHVLISLGEFLSRFSFIHVTHLPSD